MSATADSVLAEPFFLTLDGTQRFCLFYPPAPGRPCRGGVLYLPPFGEEMNKSRRMAALQARALAAQGWGVLLLDLYGCGDSSGELRDARWEGWLDDVAAACRWLDDRLGAPLTLWGLRLGALLALDYAQRAAKAPERLLLWQPVQSGALFLKQFLRLLAANDMLKAGGAPHGADPAAALRAGVMLEIAGYELAPALAAAIGALDAARLAPPCPVHWLEVASMPDRAPSPALARLAQAWQQQGTTLQLQQLQGPPFWATQEIAECAPLLAASSAALSATVAHHA